MGRPKLIDTWYYDVKDLEVTEQEPRIDEEDAPEPKKRVITTKAEVKLWIEKKTSEHGEPPYALEDISFVVECKEPKFRFVGTDISCLKAAAWAALDKRFGVKWESHFLVEVKPAHVYSGFGTGIEFTYDWVDKGTTYDGKELMRQREYRGDYKITPWPGRFTNKAGKTIACIPATDENSDALREFGKRIDKLRELIRDTLKPEVIMQTLQNLAGLALLPQTTPEPEKVEVDEPAA